MTPAAWPRPRARALSSRATGKASVRRKITRCRSRPATGCSRSTPTSASARRCRLRSRTPSRTAKPMATRCRGCRRFCGRQMRHSGWYPDYVLRLFRRGRARFSDDLVHERVICDGPVARLSEPLTHHPVRTIEDALSRMDRYSSAGADMLVESGRQCFVHDRHIARLVELHAHVFPSARISRWPRGVSACGRKRRRNILSLHEGLAEGAAAWLSRSRSSSRPATAKTRSTPFCVRCRVRRIAISR